jgi:precorrin-2/cobalt-factor-2 C20-methyltransferase
MKTGTLYGIGVGPGDPDLITVKAAKILGTCPNVFVPVSREGTDSLALSIARRHISPQAQIHEILFPMTTDRSELHTRWDESANKVAGLLETGADACFLTLGDTLLYSTYIYLLQALRNRIPELKVVTVPGITAFSAAAALGDFPVGQAKEPVTIIPTSDDLDAVRSALEYGGTVVLMKIGKRLSRILEILEETGTIERAIFVSHAGMENQQVETDLRKLKNESAEQGYLSIILIHASAKEA